jgi:hypothetical protein
MHSLPGKHAVNYRNIEREDEEEEVDEDRGNVPARGGFDIMVPNLVFPQVILRCK